MACGMSLFVLSRPKRCMRMRPSKQVKINKLTKSLRFFSESLRTFSNCSFESFATGLEVVAFLVETFAAIRRFFGESCLAVAVSSSSSGRDLFEELGLMLVFSSSTPE